MPVNPGAGSALTAHVLLWTQVIVTVGGGKEFDFERSYIFCMILAEEISEQPRAQIMRPPTILSDAQQKDESSPNKGQFIRPYNG